jgi:hypothetical protein
MYALIEFNEPGVDLESVCRHVSISTIVKKPKNSAHQGLNQLNLQHENAQ